MSPCSFYSRPPVALSSPEWGNNVLLNMHTRARKLVRHSFVRFFMEHFLCAGLAPSPEWREHRDKQDWEGPPSHSAATKLMERIHARFAECRAILVDESALAPEYRFTPEDLRDTDRWDACLTYR